MSTDQNIADIFAAEIAPAPSEVSTLATLQARLQQQEDWVSDLNSQLSEAKAAVKQTRDDILSELRKLSLKTAHMEHGGRLTSYVLRSYSLPPKGNVVERAKALEWLKQAGAPIEEDVTGLGEWCRERERKIAELEAAGEPVPDGLRIPKGLLNIYEQERLSVTKGG